MRWAVFLTGVGLWEVGLAYTGNFLLPSFIEMIHGMIHLVFIDERFWGALYVSNQALLLGYGLSIVIGIPLGLAAGRSRWIDRVLNPYVGFFLAMPIAPLIPIAIIALGLGLASRVAIVVLFAFIFITVNARAGVRNVEASLIEMGTSFGATEAQIWRKIVIPAALPAIFAGMRIGLGRAITGMVIVELLLVATGLGRLLLEFSGRLQSDLVFALVLVVVAEALILLSLMKAMERRMARWAHDISIE